VLTELYVKYIVKNIRYGTATFKSSTHARDQNIFYVYVYKTINVLPDDGPVRSETSRSLVVLKILL